MKSAYELALERMASQGIEPPDPAAMAEDVRQRIAEARKLHEAKIAELEILHRDSLAKTADREARDEMEAQHRRERGRLDDALERKIRQLRND
jgi:hypothetical protein